MHHALTLARVHPAPTGGVKGLMPAGSGKTAIGHLLTTGKPCKGSLRPTVGCNTAVILVDLPSHGDSLQHHQAFIELWDVGARACIPTPVRAAPPCSFAVPTHTMMPAGAHERYRPLRTSLYANISGVIIVCDSTSARYASCSSLHGTGVVRGQPRDAEAYCAGGMPLCPSGRQRWQGAAALLEAWRRSRRPPTRVACRCHAWSSATRRTCEVSIQPSFSVPVSVIACLMLPAVVTAGNDARCGRQGRLGNRVDQGLQRLAGDSAAAIQIQVLGSHAFWEGFSRLPVVLLLVIERRPCGSGSAKIFLMLFQAEAGAAIATSLQ